MSKKTAKVVIYEGLGFPVELHDVEMILINGEYVPKIDVRAVADEAVKSLVLQATRLTGNQVKFIRTYFSLSLREFSKVVNESHMAVKKWENSKDGLTSMDPNIELRIRLYIYDKVCVKHKSDRIKFYENYQAINRIFSQNTKARLNVA